jgi:hypothetical protein
VLVASPSCPKELKPQHSTLPPASSAHVWSPPATTVVAVEIEATRSGDVLHHSPALHHRGPLLVPIPSSAEKL